jgi:high-affinity iron transporter
VLGTFLIGLREGLEAALVVSILVAYLVKTGRRDALVPIWTGVAAAVVLSLAVGALLSFTSAQLSFTAQEALGGTLSVVAVAFVTWMVFWMRRTARSLKGELEGKVRSALVGGGVTLAVVAFLSVGREGLETALFLWAAAQSSVGTRPLLGAALGLLTAVVLAYLLYRRSVKLDLGKFFLVTGALLVVVAAGVLSYGVHDLQEAGILPGLNTLAFDVSNVIPPTSWYGTLLKGIFNFSPATTVLEAVAWLCYVVPVLTVFVVQGRRRAAPPTRSAPAASASAQPMVSGRN